MDFISTLKQQGLIAILRGITPDESENIASILYESGFRLIEVPLNSPQPYQSIARMRQCLPADCLVGAGTVLTAEQVLQVKESGGELIISPHTDPQLIEYVKSQNMTVIPGAATPSEAFSAMAAGADAIKLFPAEALPPATLKAWRAVIRKDYPLLPVGGVTPERLAEYLAAGASGFGLGGALYQPSMSAATVKQQATFFVTTWRELNT